MQTKLKFAKQDKLIRYYYFMAFTFPKNNCGQEVLTKCSDFLMLFRKTLRLKNKISDQSPNTNLLKTFKSKTITEAILLRIHFNSNTNRWDYIVYTISTPPSGNLDG